MRILHLLNHTNRLNGHVHAAVDLACAQAKLGHTVCVASGGGDFDSLLHRNAVTTVTIDHTRKPLNLVKSAARLRSHVLGWGADLVHAHMMTSAALGFPICQWLGIPLITTVHNEFEKSAILMGLGTRVIAVSAAVGSSMRKRGIPASRLRVVLNGTIGSARFEGRSEPGIVLDAPSILYVGGLHPRKGLPDLFEAFRLVRKTCSTGHLYIIGGGPFEKLYRQLVCEMECRDAVTFLGVKTDPFQWMASADIFVLPSHADPAPLVLSEAREARCAVIGTQVDGIPQLLEYGGAGILVAPRDPKGLAATLTSLLENPQRIEEWKEKSQLNIDRLTIARVAGQTMDVYLDALSKQAEPTRAAV
jgi:glycosyltransferase involved in cell wall biosynthesis